MHSRLTRPWQLTIIRAVHAYIPSPMLRIAQAAVAAALVVSTPQAQMQDAQLAMARDRLLRTYGDFKEYGLPPAAVYTQKLDRDRKAVFDALVRALFLEVEKGGRKTGARLIEFVDAVHGIWGARRKDTEGKHMFRASIVWKPGLAMALADADNITKSTRAHVLEAVKVGGDDDPLFTAFKVRTRGLETYRQDGTPSVQVSFIADMPQTGEADIDFHGWYDRCHDTPSNSDVASGAKMHSHPTKFDARYAFFQVPLGLTWTSVSHCLPVY